MIAKSFLLETFRFYPSNRSLSYWKLFATIRPIFFAPIRSRKIAAVFGAIVVNKWGLLSVGTIIYGTFASVDLLAI